MRRTTRDTLAAFLVGGGIGGGVYWLDGDAGVALVAGVCWAAGLAVTLRIGHLYPAYATGEQWTDKRWTALSAGLVSLAALVGMGATGPATGELRLGLGVLVGGAGLVAYATGTMAVLERTADDSTGAAPSPDASHSTGGD